MDALESSSIDTEIYEAVSVRDLERILTMPNIVKLSIFLSKTMFLDRDVHELLQMYPENVGAVVVGAFENSTAPIQAFSPESKFPNRGFTSTPNSDHEWNPAGTGIGDFRLPFNVLQVDSESFDMMLSSSRRFAGDRESPLASFDSPSFPRFVVESRGRMLSCNQTTEQCLSAFNCTPLGGQSVWSASGSIK